MYSMHNQISKTLARPHHFTNRGCFGPSMIELIKMHHIHLVHKC